MINSQPMTHFSSAAAIQLAHDVYGLTVTVQKLPGEYDNNFHITTETGDEFILKIMHPSREYDFVDLQCKMLAHLAHAAPALQLSRVQDTSSQQSITSVQNDAGNTRLVWLLTYIPGQLLAETNPRSPELLFSFGQFLGQMSRALSDFTHDAAHRELKWDLADGGWISDYLTYITDDKRRALVEKHIHTYLTEIAPELPQLRKSVIHGDANDYNVIVSDAKKQPRQVISVIDFGDALYTSTIFELAIALAYAIMNQTHPLAAAAQVVAGYHSVFPLTDEEIALLYPLVCMRLSVSVTNSAYRSTLEPQNDYLTISERAAWIALEQLESLHPRFAHYTFRAACDRPILPHGQQVSDWLMDNAASFASIIQPNIRTAPHTVFDLSVGSLLLGADPNTAECARLTHLLFSEMHKQGVSIGIGRYNEPRLTYRADAFSSGKYPTDEQRTIHLGTDIFMEAGTAIHAPLAGVVYCLANNDAPLDYGPLIILQHTTADDAIFYTLYGHLSKESLDTVAIGQSIAQGQRIGSIGAPPTNGNWPPHLHFQIILDLLDMAQDFPGVAYASEREIWLALSPNPNLILGLPMEHVVQTEPATLDLITARRRHVGHSLSISYQKPLQIVRGWMQYLYDETGRVYLDAYNNVPLVGHSHPRVVNAVQAQMALLNTNTRYLHQNLIDYAQRLTATMPAPLRVCFFVNSASEANELALRLARTHTGGTDIMVLEAAYHGHTTSLIDISPYKFDGPGGTGRKDWVQVAPLPDDYRGLYKRDDPDAGHKYAQHVADQIDQLQQQGRKLAAYIAESMPSVGGQIVFPPGYLREVYQYVHATGGICIADEVQVGFGRLGTHFWGFETQGVVPDIVVLGKPIANAFPLGAVVTTPEIAASFDTGMEFFSTFGGNPVACAAGLAVLDVLEDENRQQHALKIGAYLIEQLHALQQKYPIVGDVRGSGLFLGIELVRDRATLEPADDEASYVVNRLREMGILAGTDGPHHNVIKLRPPLCFTEADADLLINRLAMILAEDAVRQ